MLSKKLEDALNEQVNAEFWSAYLYLSMSADLSAKGFPGFSNWMMVQFREEQDHALRLISYIQSRGGNVQLKPIEAVKLSWDSVVSLFEDTLAHERKVTSLIDALNTLAIAEQDFATQSALKWFIDEQIEEEENAQGILNVLKLIGDNGYGVYTYDKELASRTYSEPKD